MQTLSLPDLADEQLKAAHAAHSGRAAHTIHGGSGHFLRQTVIALVAGQELAEHESPGEATLQVLRGKVVLRAGDDRCEGSAGAHLTIPPTRHALEAVDDSVILLTVLADR